MTPQGLPVAVLAGPTANIKYGRDTDGYNYTKSHIGIDTHLYSQCKFHAVEQKVYLCIQLSR